MAKDLRKHLARNYSKAVKEARRAMKSITRMLRAHGASYKRIEEDLALRPGNGMTSWRLHGNKHPPTDRRHQTFVRVGKKSVINFEGKLVINRGA